jgi:hypothetical protein
VAPHVYNTTSQPTMGLMSSRLNVKLRLRLLALLRSEVQRYYDSPRPFRAGERRLDSW